MSETLKPCGVFHLAAPENRSAVPIQILPSYLSVFSEMVFKVDAIIVIAYVQA